MSLSYCKKLHGTGELCYRISSIGPEVNGFIYRSRSGRLYILVDESISPETRARTLLHEAHHAAVDLPASGYVLGIDERRTLREHVAKNQQKNRAKQPGTLTFTPSFAGLKTDPGAFRFCQIERIFNGLRSHRDSAIQSAQKNRAGPPLPASPAATHTKATGKTC